MRGPRPASSRRTTRQVRASGVGVGCGSSAWRRRVPVDGGRRPRGRPRTSESARSPVGPAAESRRRRCVVGLVPAWTIGAPCRARPTRHASAQSRRAPAAGPPSAPDDASLPSPSSRAIATPADGVPSTTVGVPVTRGRQRSYESAACVTLVRPAERCHSTCTECLHDPVLRVVRRPRARPALARPGRVPVVGDGLGVHAPADAGGPGAAGPRGVAGALADAGRPGRRADRRGGAGLGPARLPAPGAAAARRRDRDRRAARRRGAVVVRRPARAARRRRLHRRRGRVVRLRPAPRRARHQRPPGARPRRPAASSSRRGRHQGRARPGARACCPTTSRRARPGRSR